MRRWAGESGRCSSLSILRSTALCLTLQIARQVVLPLARRHDELAVATTCRFDAITENSPLPAHSVHGATSHYQVARSGLEDWVAHAPSSSSTISSTISAERICRASTPAMSGGVQP